MEFFLLLLFLLSLYMCAPWLIRYIKVSRVNTLIMSGLLSLFLVPVSLLLLNQHELVPGEQNKAVAWAASVTGSEKGTAAHNEWVKENFLFIEDSYANQLVPLPGSNQLGSSTIAVTDRKELAQLFQSLAAEDSLVDMIICDIFFDINSPADSLLRDAMTSHAIASRLVLASNRLARNTSNFGSFNDSVYGSINEKEIDGRFATYSPVQAGRPTMAYQVYRKLFPPGKTGLGSYIPNFHFDNEDSLYVSEGTGEESVENLSESNYHELGELVSPTGLELLHALLEERRRDGKKNAVFIGSFKGQDIDVHPTYYGRLHGPTILLNLVYSLYKGQHRVPFSYVLYLWIGIAVVLYTIFRQAVHPFKLENFLKKPLHRKTGTLPYVKTMIIELLDLVVVKGFFSLVLLIFIVATVVFWDRILNGFILFLLIHFMHMILHHFVVKASKH